MTMIDNIIQRYKSLHGKALLGEVYTKRYAFVGIGSHSMTNLYPVLQYLHVQLKYIFCTSKSKKDMIQARYPHVKATTSLDEILNDSEISGVFVCAPPKSHYEIAFNVLSRGKNLFIEKPPCQSVSELLKLDEVARIMGLTAMAGLQKRYSPSYKLLRHKMRGKRVISYNMRYLTGLYPEGNPVYDLFIHPVDTLVFLFGKAEITGFSCVKSNNGGVTLMLTLKHKDVYGMVELSTAYSWANACEHLSVNTEKGVYETKQTESLTYTPKGGAILGIPYEKLYARQCITADLMHRNNFAPTLPNNQIYSQGYFNEIKTFVDAIEKGDGDIPASLDKLTDTYCLLEELERRIAGNGKNRAY